MGLEKTSSVVMNTVHVQNAKHLDGVGWSLIGENFPR